MIGASLMFGIGNGARGNFQKLAGLRDVLSASAAGEQAVMADAVEALGQDMKQKRRMAATRSGYASGTWGTYRQWAARGFQVRRGETATTLVFWKQIAKYGNGEAAADDDSEGLDQDGRHGRPRFFARGYYFFNEAQVDGQIPREPPRLPGSERIARADAFFAALRIPIVMEGNEACYRPYIDTIFMPPFERFVDAASFYSCLGHECGHAVGAAHRLNRDLTGRFDSARYAMDEVVS